MIYFIIPIIALLVLTITAFLFRRKHFLEIEKLEQEKLQIQNKPILEELTKIKQLNMTGETEEKFERWRNQWIEIMDIHMPEIDVLFFDAEDFVDRFRFGKATEIEKSIHDKILFCDSKMNDILSELNELVGSEEKNRIEIERLKEQYRKARKTILAHQHSFGKTANLLENELEILSPKFDEYDALTLNGNYLQAREIVISLSENGNKIFTLIEEIPSLLTELQHKIPTAIRELKLGIAEMEEQSYYLQHLELTKQLIEIEDNVTDMLAKIEKLEIASIQEQINEIHNRIDAFYDSLENEVVAKLFVNNEFEQIEEKLKQIIKLTRETSDEAAFVQQSYRLNETESQIPQDVMKKLETLDKRFDLLSSRIEENVSANSSLQEELQSISIELEAISIEREEFANRINNLRNDENNVRKKVKELSKKLQQADRLLQKGNIPGIPDEIDARLEEAEEQLYIVSQSLEEVPLNMTLVNTYLDNAKKSVQDVSQKVDELLENVMLIEWIIQYGNRYRATNPQIHFRLLEAEESFRQFRYTKALEEAATAVEEVEPGAMKKIEELVQEIG